MPSAAIRPSRFFADAKPRSRRISIARSSLPADSTSAFLHSIIPAPVFSRSCFTAAAVISAMITNFSERRLFVFNEKRSPAVGPLEGCAHLESGVSLSSPPQPTPGSHRARLRFPARSPWSWIRIAPPRRSWPLHCASQTLPPQLLPLRPHSLRLLQSEEHTFELQSH